MFERYDGINPAENAYQRKVMAIAEACHDANKMYCELCGDDSQPEWEDTPERQKLSVADGVDKILSEEVKTPEQSHNNWFDLKDREGWTYGPVKDVEKKEHPRMLPFNALPAEQRFKGYLFFITCRNMDGIYDAAEDKAFEAWCEDPP